MNIMEHASALCPQPISLEIDVVEKYSWEEFCYALAGCTKFQANLIRIKYALETQRLYDLSMDFWIWLDEMDRGNIIPFDRRKREFRRKIANLGMVHALTHRYEDGKFVRYDPVWRTMANLALHDHIHHHVCTVCKGIKNLTVKAETLEIKIDGETKTYQKGATLICFDCAGLGRKPQRVEERARIMELPKTTYFRKYEPIFNDLTLILANEEYEARRTIRKRLGLWAGLE